MDAFPMEKPGYLLLKTNIEHVREGMRTACAVIHVTPTLLDSWRAWMEEAALLNAKLGQYIELSWHDKTPTCYQALPAGAADFAWNGENSGWCLMTTPPFPEHEPVSLHYCGIHLTAYSMYWDYYSQDGDDWGEYTETLNPTDLDQIQAALGTRHNA